MQKNIFWINFFLGNAMTEQQSIEQQSQESKLETDLSQFPKWEEYKTKFFPKDFLHAIYSGLVS